MNPEQPHELMRWLVRGNLGLANLTALPVVTCFLNAFRAPPPDAGAYLLLLALFLAPVAALFGLAALAFRHHWRLRWFPQVAPLLYASWLLLNAISSPGP